MGKRLQHIWSSMKQRCYNENAKSYKNYGGRGIKVCDEWKNDYESFEEWALKSGYEERACYGKYTIERIDVNGDYCPDNCCWKTAKEQGNNRRTNRVIEYNGDIHTLMEWSEILEMNYQTLRGRINNYGWSIEKAFTTPIRQYPMYTCNGETHSIEGWSKILGISRQALTRRINQYNWDIEKALTITNTHKRKDVTYA